MMGGDLPPAPPGAPRCVDGHCVTCADEGTPMRVAELTAEGLALCEDGEGGRTEVMTGLVGEPAIGDTLLIHAGTALLNLTARSESEVE